MKYKVETHMHIESFRAYCLSLPQVGEYQPYGPNTLAFTIGGKHFALVSLDATPYRVNLKCDPDKAQTLRQQYDTIEPGYHMNKQHWNSIFPDQGELPESLVKELVNHSYELVKAKLPAKTRRMLEG